MFSLGISPVSDKGKLNLTPGKYPKENIQVSEHGKNLKSRILVVTSYCEYSKLVI
jgi:hypothetical protein